MRHSMPIHAHAYTDAGMKKGAQALILWGDVSQPRVPEEPAQLIGVAVCQA